MEKTVLDYFKDNFLIKAKFIFMEKTVLDHFFHNFCNNYLFYI